MNDFCDCVITFFHLKWAFPCFCDTIVIKIQRKHIIYFHGTFYIHILSLKSVICAKVCYLYLHPSNHMGYREFVYGVAVYQTYLTRLEKLIIFEPWREKLSFLPTELDN